MSIFSRYGFIVFCTLLAANAAGQAARSPFTTLGIGEPYGNALINTQGMGGVGVSQPQFWYLNNQNPALLIYNNLTVFHAGMLVERRTIVGDTTNEKNMGGNMNYLATAFPMTKKKISGITVWGSSVGLMPYTSVNYKLEYETPVENSTDSAKVTEQGEGGLNQLYWSNGVRIADGLSVGLKAAYIFGSIKSTYSNRLMESFQPINYDANVEDKAYVRDFLFSAGLSYSKDSIFTDPRYQISFGAVYSFATDLRTQFRSESYASTPSTGKLDPDTLFSVKGHYHIPRSITAGISFSRGAKWVLATEFSYQDWSTFSSLYPDDEGLGPAWRGALGGEITPDPLSAGFLKRVTYRTGVSIEQYPFLANNAEVKDVGINLGFSLPAGRSSIDFAFKFGKRGNKDQNVLEENYFKAYLGITFNDQWFIKRKFD